MRTRASMNGLGFAVALSLVALSCGSEGDAPSSTVQSESEPTDGVAEPSAEAEPTDTGRGAEETGAPPDPGPATYDYGSSGGAEVLYPDVVDAVATRDADGTWRFDVTVSSPYDSPQRYADAWRVLAPDGTELGVRVLTHDHASEQPFTRSLSGVEIADDVEVVTIEGRDQVSGWGGATIDVTLDRSS